MPPAGVVASAVAAADPACYGLVPASGFEATSKDVHRAGDHCAVASSVNVPQLECVRDAGMHRPVAWHLLTACDCPRRVDGARHRGAIMENPPCRTVMPRLGVRAIESRWFAGRADRNSGPDGLSIAAWPAGSVENPPPEVVANARSR